MISTKDTVRELIVAGYLQNSDRKPAQTLLVPYQKAAADAFSGKKFAEEDKAFQAKVISDAETLAETDLDMGQIEDRFVQAEVIDSAASLSDKDERLYEKADAMLVAASEEAALALLNNGLVGSKNLEAVTRLIADLWNPKVED
jgi:hypothetical protein